MVDFIISEDSDLLVFGSETCFYKMDRDYDGVELNLKDMMENSEFELKDLGH